MGLVAPDAKGDPEAVERVIVLFTAVALTVVIVTYGGKLSPAGVHACNKADMSPGVDTSTPAFSTPMQNSLRVLISIPSISSLRRRVALHCPAHLPSWRSQCPPPGNVI